VARHYPFTLGEGVSIKGGDSLTGSTIARSFTIVGGYYSKVGETKLNDPFIATLTDDERKQFADVFILKSKGEFPGVPDYKTGEDNSAFFRKIFVYLGKYRARIPDDLLAKIYDFSVNN
jgi:hypothetical protein